MGLNVTSTAMANCDGPNCDVEAVVENSPDAPEGWLGPIFGPSELLGAFYFHSGACYDNWRANLDAHVLTLKKQEAKINKTKAEAKAKGAKKDGAKADGAGD